MQSNPEPGTTGYEIDYLRNFNARAAKSKGMWLKDRKGRTIYGDGAAARISEADFYASYIDAARNRHDWGAIDRLLVIAEAQRLLDNV